MVTANLVFTQAAVSPGAGISMIGVAGAVVTLSSSNNSGVARWIYELLDAPLNSALTPGVLSSGTSQTATFTPDNPATPGCYRVKLTLIGLDGSTSSQIRNFAVATAQGWILPSFRSTAAELNFGGNAEGWEFFLNTIFLSLAAGAPSDVLVGNTVFVNKSGNDGTGTRGNITKPFLTIQAGLDAALESDVVIVGPGTYSEEIVWPNASGLALIGAGIGQTLIRANSANPVILVQPGALEDPIDTLRIEGLTLQQSSVAGYALAIDGSAQPTSFNAFPGGVLLTDVYITAALHGLILTTVNQITFKNVETKDTDIEFAEVGRGTMFNIISDEIQNSYDPAATPPSSGRGVIAGTGCVLTSLVVNDCAWMAFGNDCEVGTITGALTDDAGTSVYGIIDFQGRVVGNTTITVAFDDGLTAPRYPAVKFTKARLGANFIVTDAGTSSSRTYADARNAVFDAASVSQIIAGDWVDMDLRESTFTQDALGVTGTGTIDRTVWMQDVDAGTAMPLTMTFADSSGNPIPYPDLSGGGISEYPYSVYFESDAATDYPMYPTNPKTVSKPVTGGALIYTGAANPSNGTTRVTIIRQDAYASNPV